MKRFLFWVLGFVLTYLAIGALLGLILAGWKAVPAFALMWPGVLFVAWIWSGK